MRWHFIEGEPPVRPLVPESRTFRVRRPQPQGEVRVNGDGQIVRILPPAMPRNHITIDNVSPGTLFGDINGGHLRRTGKHNKP